MSKHYSYNFQHSHTFSFQHTAVKYDSFCDKCDTVFNILLLLCYFSQLVHSNLKAKMFTTEKSDFSVVIHLCSNYKWTFEIKESTLPLSYSYLAFLTKSIATMRTSVRLHEYTKGAESWVSAVCLCVTKFITQETLLVNS